MKNPFHNLMSRAAGLTRAGDLHAATAAIQAALAGRAEAADQRHASDVIEVEAREVPAQQPGTQGPTVQGFDVPRPAVPDIPTETDGTPGERFIAGSFADASSHRDYKLYIPPNAGGRPLPLVVMLHGCTQTPADFAAGTAMNELADQHGFVVLYPGQSRTANHSACWNWFEPRDQRAGQGEPAIIAGMVREVIGRYPVAPERVFVAGLSAGGAMAAILGAAYPDLFAAVAVHSGLRAGAASDLQSALAAMKRGAPSAASGAGARIDQAARRPVRTIVFHGRQDRTVHPANGRQVVEAALAAFPATALSSRQESGRSAGGRSFVRTVHVDGREVPMVEQWEVQGAGHAWSGGRKAGSHTDPLGPDASAAMAAFFMAQP